MDDMDDFGDLYGDLGFHMRDYSEKKEGGKIDANPIQADSVVKEIANFEGESNNNNNCNSDSDDDDFRIVLNENECQKFQKSKVGVDGFDEEGEFGEFDNCLNNDQLPTKETDEFAQASEVRGHRFRRHTRSHLERFRSSVGGSRLGSGAWDKLMMPCYSRAISAAAQAGSTFCLPRNRTIFDINIEAFEQKPWRFKGADMTDYFNFGLDEESWKSYWESLNHLKKQVIMPNRFPVYQSSRLNQGEGKFSVQETLEKGARMFDLPKGRAIEVEGGLSERIPSTDIRRPRARDSDVVIQINMEGSVEDESALYKNSLDHREEYTDSSLSTSGNNSNEGIVYPCQDGQISREITTSADHYFPELKGSNVKVTSGRVKNKVDCKKDEGSDSGNQVAHHSSPYNLQSHSEKSDDVFSMAEDIRPIRETSIKESEDSIESDHYLSYDSISDATESEQEECKKGAHEPDTSSGEHKHVSSRRLISVAELNVSKDAELTSGLNHWKHENDLDLLDTRCKTRKRKSNYNTEAGGHLYSYRETEMVLNYKSKMHVANRGSKSSCTVDLRKGDCVTDRTRNSDDEGYLKQREHYFSERQYEDRGRKSSARNCSGNCSGQPISKTKSSQERDSYLRLAKDREDEHWTRMEPECDDILRDHRCSERGIQDICGKQKHIRDMEEEVYDFKFQRHFYPTDKDITSPERSRYDRRFNIVKGSSKYVDDDDGDDAYHRLASHRYEEPSNIDETDSHDAFSSREHLHMSWRSKGRFVDHGGHPNTRDMQFKNNRNACLVPSIKDRHCLLYEDSLEFDIDGYISEGSIFCENVVSSIQMRRYNRLSKPNNYIDAGARFRHYKQSNPPFSERYLLERSTKHDNFHVSKPYFIRQRLFGRRQLNNAGKIRGGGMSGSDARDHVNFVPHVGKHELAAVVSREAVNKHLNGFKGKQLARRCRGFLGESYKEIGTGYKLDNQLKNFKHPKNASKQEAIHNGECSHSYQTGLKVDKIKDPKKFNNLPVSQNVEDNEIEEGELIEGFDKQDTVSGKRVWNSWKKIENFQSKDSSRSVKIAGIYDNSQILKTMAKMEKRKERFKEPIVPKKEPEKAVNPQLDVSIVTDVVKEQRPARKRRWGGSTHSSG